MFVVYALIAAAIAAAAATAVGAATGKYEKGGFNEAFGDFFKYTVMGFGAGAVGGAAGAAGGAAADTGGAAADLAGMGLSGGGGSAAGAAAEAGGSALTTAQQAALSTQMEAADMGVSGAIESPTVDPVPDLGLSVPEGMDTPGFFSQAMDFAKSPTNELFKMLGGTEEQIAQSEQYKDIYDLANDVFKTSDQYLGPQEKQDVMPNYRDAFAAFKPQTRAGKDIGIQALIESGLDPALAHLTGQDYFAQLGFDPFKEEYNSSLGGDSTVFKF